MAVQPWLVLSPRYTEDSVALRRAAIAAGWHVVRVPGWRWTQPPGPEVPVAIYGEPLFVRVVAAQGGRVVLEPPLDWLPRLPPALLGRAVDAGVFADRLGLRYPRFVKPADDKAFPAAVYADADAIPFSASIDPEVAILHSDPVQFESEYRCFVVHGRAVAHSLYSVNGALVETPGEPEAIAAAVAVAEAAAAAGAAMTPPGVVIDVGRTADGAYVVIEANPAFGSGMYRADPAGVLAVLSAICRPAVDLPAALEPFVQSVVVE
jgi:hypothetical protein